MTRDEIITALRLCAENAGCNECPIGFDNPDCIEKMAGLAADRIENQQRHIEALMKANDSLKDAIARRDAGAIRAECARHLYGGVTRLGEELSTKFADYFVPGSHWPAPVTPEQEETAP